MTKRNTVEESLNTQHEAILQAELDEPGSEKPGRTNRIESYYVAEYTTHIFENLRFYKRKNGKYVAVYVNKKGKGMKNPSHRYIESVNGKLDAMKYTVDRTVIAHWKEHIRTKILKNQKDTIKRLLKEKQNA